MSNNGTTQIGRGVVEALDAVYRTFKRPAPSVIEGCPCCIDTRNTDVLLTMPLRQISGKALWRYVSGAFITVGGETDFRYLLPRIFEVAVSDSGNVPDAEIVLGKLSLANWHLWEASEREVVEVFVHAWFEETIERSYAWQAESVLCGAALAGLPLAPFLSTLTKPDSQPIVTAMTQQLPCKPLYFWADVPADFYEVRAFLNRDGP